jgi:signal transduction histidine kinase
VIGPAIAAGWLAAALGCAFAVTMWRSRAARMEAVARTCHELRGPITAARLGLHLCARTAELTPAQLRAIDLELGRAALALDDLSRAALPLEDPAAPRHRGRPLRATEDFDVAELLADAVEASRAGAAERGIDLELVWTGANARVPGNRLRVAQAIRNLIANAVEHGGGRIEVCGRGEGSCVRVEVIDGGPGLPAPVAELARRARGGRGSRGRGLAIAASIAADHGGRLASAPSERGARLVLELPGVAGRCDSRGGA